MKYEKLNFELFEFIDFGKEEHVKAAKKLLKERRASYDRKKPCKWFVMLIFMLIGSVFLVIFTRAITML